MKHFIPGNLVSADVETTGLRPWHGDRPFAFSFCNEVGETAYFEFPVDPRTRKPQLEDDTLWKLQEFFADTAVTKVFHNGRFDIRMLETLGITVCGPGGPVAEGGKFHETMFMAHALNTQEKSYGLKQLARKYLAIQHDDKDSLQEEVRRLRRYAAKAGWNVAYDVHVKPDGTEARKAVVEADYWVPHTAVVRKESWASAATAALCKVYAVTDAERTMLLCKMYLEAMEDEEVLDTYEREMALWPTIYKMETRGVRVDPEVVQREKKDCLQRIDANRTALRKLANDKTFNPESHKQVAQLLTRYKVPSAFDKHGKATTASKQLVGHLEHPVVQALLKYRAASKAFGTFFAKYELLSVPDTLVPGGTCVHPGVRQVGPATGRTACADPNLQQAASPEMTRSTEPIAARTPFGPRPGCVWLCIDYSGQEMRVFADVADEPNMLGALKRGEDIHSFGVQRVYGGEGNPLGVKEAMKMLELDGTGTGRMPAVQEAWGWLKLPANPMALPYDERRWAGVRWLKRFEFQIEAAEKFLGKKNVRSITKQVGFLKIYGGGAGALADLIKCTLEEARSIIRAYDQAFPRIRRYSHELVREAKRNGYIRTRWNRRITVDRDFAYAAVNYMVQGSCADMLKSVIFRADQMFKARGLDAHVVLPVHDEVIYEVRHSQCTRKLVREICAIMEDSEGRLRVAMPVDPSLVTESWDKKVALDVHRS